MSRMAANTVRAYRAGWIAPWPKNREYIGGSINTNTPYFGDLVPSAVMYLTCMNIALDNGAQALESWCDKWLG